jgi:undecaprenyl pyrophosphate phosphatase UppP
MSWMVWIKGYLSTALGWCEAHPGIANWLQAIGSIAAIALIYLFALFQFRRTRSHEEIDRIRKAQGLALILVAVLVAFKPKIEAAIAQQSKIEPPDEALRLLDQLYVLGVAGGLILQMIATLQAHDQAASPSDEAEDVRNSYASIGRQRLDLALRYCEDAIDALTKLTRVRTA